MTAATPCGIESGPTLASGGDGRWQAAQAMLDLLRFAFGSDAAALFACDAGGAAGPHLVTSEGLSQVGLDAVRAAWRSSRKALGEGEPAGTNDPPCLVLPCADRDGLVGLAYVEGPAVFSPSRLSSLVPLGPFLARLLRRLAEAGEPAEVVVVEPARPPRVDVAQLQVLLERNEWNVSRVARMLGVTRMTVYNRMRRAGMPRQRVFKTPRRRRAAASSKTTDTKSLPGG